MVCIALQKKDISAAEVVNTCVETHHNIPRLKFFNVDRDIYLRSIHARNRAMKCTGSERSHHHSVWTLIVLVLSFSTHQSLLFIRFEYCVTSLCRNHLDQ